MSGETLRDASNVGGSTAALLHDHLYLVLECDRPLASGMRFDLCGIHEVIFGRAASRSACRESIGGVSKLVVSVPDRAMSATHARLVRVEGGWIVEDLRSTNGTLVNGRSPTGRPLVSDDILELGHTLFTFGSNVVTPEGSPDILDAASPTPVVSGFATLLPSLMTELEALARIAQSAVPILVLGETGTGKEVLARAVHTLSRRTSDFVAVNCAALPDTLVESQLFGHCRGAFSGAVKDQPGLVRASSGGTLILDEIGDLSLSAQAALLRVLQEREVLPIGATRPIKVDVRTVSATHRDLPAMVSDGTFRADLLARLDGFTFHAPPLRARRADLGVLIAALLAKLGGEALHMTFETRAARALLSYAWPTNIRGLEQCLARATTLATEQIVRFEHLPAAIARGKVDATKPEPTPAPSGDALREQLVSELRRAHGNVAAVARTFEKSPVQVHRWMKRFGLDPRDFRDGSAEKASAETT